ncbi:MAG TPA: ABC transporter permease [Kofleriaceae bacterium]|nr:ABC transporter permease [Kofleriaceae bacterium]
MSPLAIVRVAGRALVRNKMRSALTSLGIVIGVGAVIAMVAIGEGARRRVEQTFEAMGTNLLVVLPGSATSGGMMGGTGTQATLTWADLAAIRKECKAVAAAAPLLRAGKVVQSEDRNWTTSIVGTSPDYQTIRNWRIARGHAFDDGDVEASAKVVVLGETVVDRLWGPGYDPIGQSVRIQAIPFQVIGVLERKGQSPVGQDYDDTILMPYTTFQTKITAGLGGYVNGAIFVSAVAPDQTERAQDEITNLLRDRHHLLPGADDDFSVRNLSEIAAAQQQGTAILTALLAAIAAVSLLVGGIGIMNIMLVSVTERTREIGVRMAVGARSWDVLAQFLAEALALSLAGGMIGIILGFAAAYEIAAHFHWPFVIHGSVLLISVGFSALVGIVFGFFPARKAARLDPIEALRFE